MANLAIKGHATRGKEIIEILEMLGGVNKYHREGNVISLYYYIGSPTHIYSIKEISPTEYLVFTLEEFLEKFPYKVGDKVSSKYLKNYEVSKMEWESVNNRVIYKLQGMGWYSADELQPYKEETMEIPEKLKPVIDLTEYSKDEYIIKLGNYEIKEVDRVVKAVRKRHQYPKTYEECCKVLFPNSNELWEVLASGYNSELLEKLGELLICRNTYWKIYGERMGLGKPWKPSKNVSVYCIFRYKGEIVKDNFVFADSLILEFPTEEMRDAFYENFKDLIEQCKELL